MIFHNRAHATVESQEIKENLAMEQTPSLASSPHTPPLRDVIAPGVTEAARPARTFYGHTPDPMPAQAKVSAPKMRRVVSTRKIAPPPSPVTTTDDARQIVEDFATAAVSFAIALFDFRDADTALYGSGLDPADVRAELLDLGYSEDEIGEMMALTITHLIEPEMAKAKGAVAPKVAQKTATTVLDLTRQNVSDEAKAQMTFVQDLPHNCQLWRLKNGDFAKIRRWQTGREMKRKVLG